MPVSQNNTKNDVETEIKDKKEIKNLKCLKN
jgi:hypothetical protein